MHAGASLTEDRTNAVERTMYPNGSLFLSHLFKHLARLFSFVELGELDHHTRTQPGAEVGRAGTEEAKLVTVPVAAQY